MFFTIGVCSYYQKIDLWINRELMVLPFFYLGYLVGNNKLSIVLGNRMKLLILIASFVVLAIVSSYAEISIGSNAYGPYLIYFVSSCCGIYIVLYVCRFFKANNGASVFLDKLGRVTIQIMTFHFLCFKVLTLFLIRAFNLSNTYLMEWPVPVELRSFWILYSLVGIIGPWLIYCSSKKLTIKFMSLN